MTEDKFSRMRHKVTDDTAFKYQIVKQMLVQNMLAAKRKKYLTNNQLEQESVLSIVIGLSHMW